MPMLRSRLGRHIDPDTPIGKPRHSVSSIGTPSGDAYAPATPSSPAPTGNGPETPWIGDEPDINKWYHHYQRPGKKGHPYSLVYAAMQEEGQIRCCLDIRFFPWVGPWTPPRSAPDVDWAEWENVVAISVIDNKVKRGEVDKEERCSLIVGKITDEEPWETLWTLDIERIFRCAWSYDQFTMHPLIICGGMEGVIYIIDAVDHTLVKTYTGHGDEILSIDVCQAMPHIFATGSTDFTTRIWNIHGAPPPIIPKIERSDNYPMADADEGTECFTVLAGAGYGHRERVVHVAFHPRHNALATGGADHGVKIWALPDLPLPTPDAVTPRGYRPHVLPHPVFSSTRVHDDVVDWIDWIDDDVLVSRDVKKLVVWHWLGYKRFFHPYSFQAMSSYAQHTDMFDSHSFAHVISYPVPHGAETMRWYICPSVHRAFQPEESERAKFRDYPHLVTSCLIAMPVQSGTPTVLLFNPSLAEPGSPPPPIKELRPLHTDKDFEDPSPLEEEEDLQGSGMDVNLPENGQEEATVHIDRIIRVSDSEDESPEVILSAIDSVKLKPRARNPNPLIGGVTKSGVSQRRQNRPHNPTIAPWVLNVKDWKNIKKISPVAKQVSLDRHYFQNCAISPRGAKYIVASGDCEGVFVFAQRE